MHEQELRKHRCCFTGHRPEKLNISEEQLCVRLGQEIDQAIEDGFTTFISGMAKGVDICAAELVLKRRVSDARLKLICALPYENFGLHWSTSWTDRYVEVIRHADLVRCISQEFSYSTYQRRNEWIQNQFRIRQRIVVDEPVQFRPLETAIRNFVLYRGAINGNHAVVRIS